MNCCSISVKAALKHLSSFVFLETTAEDGGWGGMGFIYFAVQGASSSDVSSYRASAEMVINSRLQGGNFYHTISIYYTASSSFELFFLTPKCRSVE